MKFRTKRSFAAFIECATVSARSGPCFFLTRKAP
jgi:hypothetical protein